LREQIVESDAEREQRGADLLQLSAEPFSLPPSAPFPSTRGRARRLPPAQLRHAADGGSSLSPAGARVAPPLAQPSTPHLEHPAL